MQERNIAVSVFIPVLGVFERDAALTVSDVPETGRLRRVRSTTIAVPSPRVTPPKRPRRRPRRVACRFIDVTAQATFRLPSTVVPVQDSLNDARTD